ncbi:uncharacterized protein LOC121421251 [Lytechinus variegatus]|uniref:uncharacterized protein LOC121421251 n=1 Tax=Lytechinus variegatus TaxID=7654 RepID=UPI001BB2493B|nr:uncharacterized protein LOC121421251 [Lytechinus variegatus]
MAEKAETSSPPQSLKCPLCLDIFVDAAVLPTCGHTFCRKCIKKHEQAHPNDYHMECPVCRKVSMFTSSKRSDDFPANVTVNGFIDDYNNDHRCKSEIRLECTNDRQYGGMMPFCETCKTFLCGKCLKKHQEMSFLFGGHEIEHKKKRFQPTDDPVLDFRSISLSNPKLEVIRCVDLRAIMSGMTKYSDNRVGIGYGDVNGIDIIDSAGRTQPYRNIPSDWGYGDLVFLEGMSLCVTTGTGDDEKYIRVYSSKGSEKPPTRFTGSGVLGLNRGTSDDIIVTLEEIFFYIFDPMRTTLKNFVLTRPKTCHASASSSGLIIVSSCYFSPSVVTVYDKDGNSGESLQAPEDVQLYAAVDKQDRVYVASAMKNGELVIRLYDIDGLNLKKRVEFQALNLKEMDPTWSYLVSLSHEMLAFASGLKLYFIEVPLE